MHHIADEVVLLNITHEGSAISCDLLWCDKYCPLLIEIEGLGKFKVPENMSMKKTSSVLVDAVLDVV